MLLGLTHAKYKVLCYMDAMVYGNKQIGYNLDMAEATVKASMSTRQLFRKAWH